MGRGRTVRTLVTRLGPGGGGGRRPDELIVEEPLEVRLDGATATTTMRTPGNDFELAAGWCFTEGLLAGATVRAVHYCGASGDGVYNTVTVDTAGAAPPPVARLRPTTSSCGLCGSSSLHDLRARLAPVPAPGSVAPAVLASVPARVRSAQPLFDRTGAVHAAAAFDGDGAPVAVREDVGRHNAVDKVVGHLLLAGRLPARGLGLYVSGRASFEIVQKAWAAGFAAVVAVSAPTALAVEAARAAGLTLGGFFRGERFNLYAP